MKANTTKLQFTRRTLWVGLTSLLAALMLVGVYAYVFGEPAQPWVVKWRISRYLKAHGAWRAPQVLFPFPSKQEMAKTPPSAKEPEAAKLTVGPQTKLDFEALKNQYVKLKLEALELERQLARLQARAGSSNSLQAPAATLLQQKLTEKEQSIAPLCADLWAFQRAWNTDREFVREVGAEDLLAAWAEFSRDLRGRFYDAASYDAMYQIIGEELWVADRLFPSRNPEHRRVALRIVRQAAADALDQAENGWLAARIYEAYVLPHLDLADPSGTRAPSPDGLLKECVGVFSRNDEAQNVIRTFALVVAKSPSPQAADAARVQLAMACENMGQYKLAVTYLKQVKATTNYPWLPKRLPRLETLARSQ